MRLLYLYLIFLVIGLIGCEARRPEGLAPGNFAPEFKVQAIQQLKNNKLITLQDYQGNVVLLNFWASWCAPCLLELSSLEQLYQQNKAQNFVVLAIALDDTEEAVKNVINEYKLSFPIALDNSGKLKRSYQITGFPESLLLDKQGKITLINDQQAGLVNKIRGERNWYSESYKNMVSELLVK